MNAVVKKGHEKESGGQAVPKTKKETRSQENVVSPRNDRGCIKGTCKMEVKCREKRTHTLVFVFRLGAPRRMHFRGTCNLFLVKGGRALDRNGR